MFITPLRPLETIYIGMGANLPGPLGHPRKTLDAACEQLGKFIGAIRVSTYRLTPAWGGVPQPDYLNAVLEGNCMIPPRELIARLLSLETELGRNRDPDVVRWGPRVIDLDLLFYGLRVINEPGLIVPHPRLHERRFVLEPMSELVPDLRHPVLGASMSELLANT